VSWSDLGARVLTHVLRGRLFEIPATDARRLQAFPYTNVDPPEALRRE
jgi:hypothetical protein